MAGASSAPNCPKSKISPSSISGGRNSFKSISAEARADENMSIVVGGSWNEDEVEEEEEEPGAEEVSEERGGG